MEIKGKMPVTTLKSRVESKAVGEEAPVDQFC